MRHRLYFFLICLLVPAAALAGDTELADLFSRVGVTGTIVIEPLQGEGYAHDNQRSTQRLPVASTFKNLKTLIALE